MASLVEDLRREILRSAAHGLGRKVVLDALLAQAEVREFNMAISIKENILRFEIPIDDVQPVQILDGQQDLRGVKSPTALGEAASPAEVEKELAPGAILQDEVELLGCLEGVVQRHDKRVRDGLQDVPLRLSVLDLVALDDILLPEHFHRIHAVLFVLVPHEHDLAVGTLADDLHQREVIEARDPRGLGRRGLRHPRGAALRTAAEGPRRV
mmetsp:Transcript_122498/g.305938  ORF Transcript_122498/g.305938 Transcript_122498/m.305938 type:complete len:211 (+) Transcript_122498:548-1180(+)